MIWLLLWLRLRGWSNVLRIQIPRLLTERPLHHLNAELWEEAGPAAGRGIEFESRVQTTSMSTTIPDPSDAKCLPSSATLSVSLIAIRRWDNARIHFRHSWIPS